MTSEELHMWVKTFSWTRQGEGNVFIPNQEKSPTETVGYRYRIQPCGAQRNPVLLDSRRHLSGRVAVRLRVRTPSQGPAGQIPLQKIQLS